MSPTTAEIQSAYSKVLPHWLTENIVGQINYLSIFLSVNSIFFPEKRKTLHSKLQWGCSWCNG